MRAICLGIALLAAAALSAACQGTPPAGEAQATAPAGAAETTPAGDRQVAVYTPVDQPVAEKVLADFEAEAGIEVLPVFDVEAAKTTGLVNRLIEEQSRPQADVWWNNEFAQTIELAQKGLFQPYASPSAADVPAHYVDPNGLWTGFGGRARVLLVNTDRLQPGQYPDSLDDLATAELPPDQVAMALPLFGTAATHAAALYADLGPEEARAFYQQLLDRGIRVVDGNSVVRDLVASGEIAWGITDTDDACGAVERGAPVKLIFPDQGEGGRGTLVIPNTVAMVAGAPHPEEAKVLIDYLLSPKVEAAMMEEGFLHVPSRPLGVAQTCIDTSNLRAMEVGFADIAGQIETIKSELADMFLR
jgi:iron(III) transport system substrate-binding protein